MQQVVVQPKTVQNQSIDLVSLRRVVQASLEIARALGIMDESEYEFIVNNTIESMTPESVLRLSEIARAASTALEVEARYRIYSRNY
jgi:hypothetical protein